VILLGVHSNFKIFMTNSKQLAGLIGPTIIVVTLSELANIHIWSANTAAGVHLSTARSCLLQDFQSFGFTIIGSAIGPIVVTLAGWLCILTGIFRMFAPELQLEAANNTYAIRLGAIVVLVLGIFLTIKSYDWNKVKSKYGHRRIH
jgi:hypothetical protein